MNALPYSLSEWIDLLHSLLRTHSAHAIEYRFHELLKLEPQTDFEKSICPKLEHLRDTFAADWNLDRFSVAVIDQLSEALSDLRMQTVNFVAAKANAKPVVAETGIGIDCLFMD